MRRKTGFILWLEPARLFGIACVGWAIGAVYTELIEARSTFDIQIHDTYFVIAHAHICLGFAVVFGAFGLIYHYNRRMGRALGMIHFGLTFLASLVFISPASWAEDMPGGYLGHSNWISLDAMGTYQKILLWLLLPGLAAQLVFLVNVVYSMAGGRKSVD